MKTKLFLILLVLIVLLFSGCPKQLSSEGDDDTYNYSTPEGIARYLKVLPAVKKVQTWQNDYSPGVIITTEHYNIHTTLLDPLMLRQVPGFMESAYNAYQKQLPRPISTKVKFTVYLFRDRSQWEDFTMTFAEPHGDNYMQIKKGAYYLNGACVAYNIGRKKTFGVLAHEGWHQFDSRHFTFRLPSWLDEGIATLFESSRYENGFFVFEPERSGRLGSLRKTLIIDKMIPLEELITLNPGQVINETDAVAAFYAQSYALVRFLREEGYGKRLKSYHNMLIDALRGNWPLDARQKEIAANRNIPMTAHFNSFVSSKLFSHYIHQDPEMLDNEYKAFCRKIVYHVRLEE